MMFKFGQMTRTGSTWLRAVGAILMVTMALVLAGCQQDVYTNLTEEEANQMLAELIGNGVPAEKLAKGKEGFTVAVDNNDMLRAIAILNDAGFPKRSRESIGKVFQKSGIMSSPFEERVRYIYALGEDVAQTLSHIDGVVTARVHIVLPDAPQLGQPVKPSSAAVFIKHQPGVDLDFFVPQIRRLVSSAVEGLEYSAVTVVLAEAAPTKLTTAQQLSSTVDVLPGLAVKDGNVQRFWQVAIAALVILGVLLVTNIGTLVMLMRGRTRRRSSVTGEVAMVEPS